MMEPASFLEVSATKHSSFLWEEQEAEMSSEPQGAGKLRYEDCTVPETSVSVYEALYRRCVA